jgi:isocitrate/isopropylmalate dehydrogenase
VLADGRSLTRDLGGKANTKELGDALASIVRETTHAAA